MAQFNSETLLRGDYLLLCVYQLQQIAASS